MKKHNYKLIIAVIFGILLFVSVVYGSILYSSNVVLYDNSASKLNGTTVQAAIDALTTKYQLPTTCPAGKTCITPPPGWLSLALRTPLSRPVGSPVGKRTQGGYMLSHH